MLLALLFTENSHSLIPVLKEGGQQISIYRKRINLAYSFLGSDVLIERDFPRLSVM